MACLVLSGSQVRFLTAGHQELETPCTIRRLLHQVHQISVAATLCPPGGFR
jgi:hypothetical protein